MFSFFSFQEKISRLVFSYLRSRMPIKCQSGDAEWVVGMWVGAQERRSKVIIVPMTTGSSTSGQAPRRHLLQALAAALWLLLPRMLCPHFCSVGSYSSLETCSRGTSCLKAPPECPGESPSALPSPAVPCHMPQ